MPNAIVATTTLRSEPVHQSCTSTRACRELQVIGPEVMAPFRDAVRLVDREQRDLRLAELLQESLVVEALGRDVEQLQAAGAKAFGDGSHLVRVEARVEPRCVDAARREEVDLVLHQRDQRRDHDGHAVEQQRRQLIAEALPSTGRENGERGASGEQRLDDLLLARAERGEAELLLEYLARRNQLPACRRRR